MKKDKLVFPESAGTPGYKKTLEEILASGKCPFCPENFKYHEKPILEEKDEWFITESTWPYKNASNHFLIIGKKHKEKLDELTTKDLKTIYYLANKISVEKGMRGGGFMLRFGDGNITGASVMHLHFHLIFPKKGKTVWFPIGPKKEPS